MIINHKKIILVSIPVVILVVVIIFGLLPTSSSNTQPPISPFPTVPPTTIIPIQYPYTDPAKKFMVYYLPDSGQYTIVILASPFDQIRPLAEQAFLTQLKLTSTQACQKKVSVSTPRYANPDLAGQIFPLSFCSPTPTN